jgi:hypothetical protein
MPLECSPNHELLRVDAFQRSEKIQGYSVIDQTLVGPKECILKKIDFIFVGEELNAEKKSCRSGRDTEH